MIFGGGESAWWSVDTMIFWNSVGLDFWFSLFFCPQAYAFLQLAFYSFHLYVLFSFLLFYEVVELA
jgi:hypothetical protein